ncbi:MAG: trimethylamine methyltransferase family protein [Desulfobacterales bacterium]|nr:trimethylamine methyltransferase family protein [Desulfobacterales bacterium]
MTDALKKIHQASIRILEEIGIRIHHSGALKRLKEKGIRIEDDIVFFTESQVMHWVDKAPGRFTLYARNSDYNFLIGGNRTTYATGYGTPTIVEADGSRRPALMSDFLDFARLVHTSSYFNINGGILVQPSDIPADLSQILMTYATLTHSDKCLMGLPGSPEEVVHIMEMAAIANGGTDTLKQRPHVLTMISTISPLQIDRLALDSMMTCASYNQPLIISPAPAAGLTGPVTMAGNVSLANAEALACIAVAQILKEGLPVIYGLQSYAADMQSGQISIGSPGYSIQAKYCAGMARMYGLPSRTGGTNTDAKGVCAQSGYESMMSMMSACQNGVNLIVHSAGILDSYGASSFEKFICDLEVISMVEAYLSDMTHDPEDFAFDAIKSAGIGGQFLTSPHTAQRCRTHSWHPTIGSRGFAASDDPNRAIMENCQKEKEKMLERYTRPELEKETEDCLRDYLINRAGAPKELVERIDKR